MRNPNKGNSLNCSIDNYYISPDFEFFKKKKKHIFDFQESCAYITCQQKWKPELLHTIYVWKDLKQILQRYPKKAKGSCY